MKSDQAVVLQSPRYRAEPRERILARFEELGIVLINNHFVYTAGSHGDVYVDKRDILKDSMLVENVAMSLLEVWNVPQDFHHGYRFLGPEEAGFKFAEAVHKQAQMAGGFPTSGLPICARKDGQGGFELDEDVQGIKLVIIEDVMNTGTTTQKVIELARAKGGDVIAVLVVCNRSQQTTQSLNVPFLGSFLTLTGLKKYQPDQCPYCTDPAQQLPICTRPKVGHGESFVAKFGQPPYSEEVMKQIMADFHTKNSK